MSNIELFAKTVNGSALNYLLKKFHLKMFNKVPNTSLLSLSRRDHLEVLTRGLNM